MFFTIVNILSYWGMRIFMLGHPYLGPCSRYERITLSLSVLPRVRFPILPIRFRFQRRDARGSFSRIANSSFQGLREFLHVCSSSLSIKFMSGVLLNECETLLRTVSAVEPQPDLLARDPKGFAHVTILEIQRCSVGIEECHRVLHTFRFDEAADVFLAQDGVAEDNAYAEIVTDFQHRLVVLLQKIRHDGVGGDHGVRAVEFRQRHIPARRGHLDEIEHLAAALTDPESDENQREVWILGREEIREDGVHLVATWIVFIEIGRAHV